MKHMAPRGSSARGRGHGVPQDVSNEQIALVVQEFSDKISRVSPIGVGAGDFTRRVMGEALGENKARNMLNRVMQGSTTKEWTP